MMLTEILVKFKQFEALKKQTIANINQSLFGFRWNDGVCLTEIKTFSRNTSRNACLLG